MITAGLVVPRTHCTVLRFVLRIFQVLRFLQRAVMLKLVLLDKLVSTYRHRADGRLIIETLCPSFGS